MQRELEHQFTNQMWSENEYGFWEKTEGNFNMKCMRLELMGPPLLTFIVRLTVSWADDAPISVIDLSLTVKEQELDLAMLMVSMQARLEEMHAAYLRFVCPT